MRPPEVDRARIGMIGHSLGGQETLFTTAADLRIRRARPVAEA